MCDMFCWNLIELLEPESCIYIHTKELSESSTSKGSGKLTFDILKLVCYNTQTFYDKDLLSPCSSIDNGHLGLENSTQIANSKYDSHVLWWQQQRNWNCQRTKLTNTNRLSIIPLPVSKGAEQQGTLGWPQWCRVTAPVAAAVAPSGGCAVDAVVQRSPPAWCCQAEPQGRTGQHRRGHWVL